MKIIRTEEGRYVRTTILKINEDLVKTINAALEAATVDGTKHEPITLEELWGILNDSTNAPRAQEEYFVELEFYTGNMKLGNFIRCEINKYFEEADGESEESPEIWYDEFYG